MSQVEMLNTNSVELSNGITETKFIDGLVDAIEKKHALLNDSRASSYSRLDLVKLSISIETTKLRFIHGQITSKQLYRDVTVQIGRFKIKHHDFDYINENFITAYF